MENTVTLDLAKVESEIGKLIAEAGKLNAETGKLNAEARKLTREAFWYPVAIATALIGSVSGATAVLIKLLG